MKKLKSLISVTLAASMVMSVSGCLNINGSPMGPSALEKYAKEFGAEQYKSSRDFSDFYKETYSDVEKLKEGIYLRAGGKEAGLAIECSDEIPIIYSEEIKEATVFAAGDMRYNKFNECFCVSMSFNSERDADMYYDLALDSYYVPNQSNVIEASEFDPRMLFDIYTNDQQIESARQALIKELTDLGAPQLLIDEWVKVFDGMCDVDHDLVLKSFEEDDGMRYTLLTGTHGDVFYTAGIYVDKNTVFYAYGFGCDRYRVNDYIDGICEYMELTPPSSL